MVKEKKAQSSDKSRPVLKKAHPGSGTCLSFVVYLLPPTLVAVMMMEVWALFGNEDIPLLEGSLHSYDTIAVKETARRYSLVAISLLLVFVAAGTVIACYWLIGMRLSKQDRHNAYLVGGILSLALVMNDLRWTIEQWPVYKWFCGQCESTKLYFYLGKNFFVDSLGRQPDADPETWTLLDTLTAIVSLGNVSAILAGIAIALATCTLLVEPPAFAVGRKTSKRRDLLGEHYARALSTLNRLLWVGGLILFSGVALTYAWQSWPQDYLKLAGQQEDHIALVRSATAIQGVFFSAILATIYLPAAAVLRHRMHGLIDGTSGWPQVDYDPSDWLKQRRWVHKRPEWLTSIVALLAPMLVPGVADILRFAFQ